MGHPQKKRVNIKHDPDVVKLEKLEPVELKDVELVFPADVRRLMPLPEEIPEKFQMGNYTPWNSLATHLFFNGGNLKFLEPNEGIDKVKALRHIKAILGSYQPKHQHKEATVAYLLSVWFKELPENWKELASASVE